MILVLIVVAFLTIRADGAEIVWTYVSRLGIVSDPAFSSLSNSVYWTSKLGRLMSVDVNTGKELWSHNLKLGLVDRSKVSAPAIHKGNVYIGGVNCLNGTTGRSIWTRDLPNTQISSVGVSPDGTYALLGSADGTFYALHARNGSFLYSKQLVGKKLTKVVIHQIKQKTIALVGSQPMTTREGADLSSPLDQGGYLYAIDVRARAILWKFSPNPAAFFFGAPSDQVVMTGPSAAGTTTAGAASLVYAASSDPPKQKTFVHALDVGTGKELWRYLAQGRILSAPVLCPIDGGDGGAVYVAGMDGRVTSLDALTGKRRWASTKEASISGAVVLDCNPSVPRSRRHLYVGNNVGTLYAVDRDSGATRWTFRQASSKHAIFSTPLLLPYSAGDNNASLVYGNLNGDLLRVNAYFASAGPDLRDRNKESHTGPGGDNGGRDVPRVAPPDGEHDVPGRRDDPGSGSGNPGRDRTNPERGSTNPPLRTPGSPTASPTTSPTTSPHQETRVEGLEVPSLWLVLALFLLLGGVLGVLYGHYKPRVVAALSAMKRRMSPDAAAKLDAVASSVQGHWQRFSRSVRVVIDAVVRYFDRGTGLELAPLGGRRYAQLPQDADDDGGGRDREYGGRQFYDLEEEGEYGNDDDDDDDEEEEEEEEEEEDEEDGGGSDDGEDNYADGPQRGPPSGPPPTPPPPKHVPTPLRASAQGMRQRIGSDTSSVPPSADKRIRSRSRGNSSDSQLEEFYRPA